MTDTEEEVDYVLRFIVKIDVVEKSLYLVGSCPELGNWNPDQGVKLRDRHDKQDPSWTVRIHNSSLRKFEYKYAMKDLESKTWIWEQEFNRSIDLSSKCKSKFNLVIIVDKWDQQEHQLFKIEPKPIVDSTAVVVLGNALQPDGKPSPTMISRMAIASEVFLREREKNPKSLMIVSGGKLQKN